MSDIGYYPQTQIEVGWSALVDRPSEYYNKFVENGKVFINSQAKKTNLLDKSPLSDGLIVDEKFKDILNDFKLPTHKFYPIPTFHNGKELQYFWLKLIQSTRFIDMDKSLMEIYAKSNFQVIGELKLRSIDFKQRISKSLTFEEGLKISKLVLRKDFPDYDLFTFTDLTTGEFISEKLKKKLESEEVTGIALRENKVINFVE